MTMAIISRKNIPVRTYQVLNVVHPKLAAEMEAYKLRLSVHGAGYPQLIDWHPVIPEGWGEFPSVDVQRATIYRGNEESWAYSHHQTITRFGSRYVVSWSNGFRHEDYVGQEVHYSWSEDGIGWSEAGVVVHTPSDSGLVRNNAGLCAANGLLYCYVCTARDLERDVTPPGMCSLSDPGIRLDVYVTSDLVHWERHENICENVYLFEGPRPTQSGKMMCCGFDLRDNHAMVLTWDDPSALAEAPRVVRIFPSPGGMLPEQGTWYQTADGRIWMYQRDSTVSCRLGLIVSDDDGETWSDPLRTDFPNTYSRAFAGQLPDGRSYIVGNNYDLLLDRRHLMIALSDDGYMFDRQYVLVEGDVTRRINGRHKEDGYQYPNCLADGDKLLVVYSVNKEDIEVSTVDMSLVL